MGYLNFVPGVPSASGKTKTWSVESRGGDLLMRVSWYAPWRRYTVDTGGCKTICDSACFREIADFLDKVNDDHKRKA